MLDLFEKIAVGVCAFCALLTLGLYLDVYKYVGIPIGVPSTQPIVMLPVAKVEAARATPRNTPEARAEGQKIAEENQKVMGLYKRQNPKVRSRQLERVNVTVDKNVFEIAAMERNWYPELKRIQPNYLSVNGTTTRVRLEKIEDDALMKKIGFEDGDTIELIDGEIVEFSLSNRQQYFQKARDAMERMRRGEQISITVTRKGRPVHLQFGLPKRRR